MLNLKVMLWQLVNLGDFKTEQVTTFSSSHLCIFHGVSHVKIGGQCNCKAAVTGRQCAHCLPGWYGLNATNPTGCTSCNCSDQGTVITSTGAVSICNQHTGQCLCKPHVTGKYVKNPAKDCICVSKKT